MSIDERLSMAITALDERLAAGDVPSGLLAAVGLAERLRVRLLDVPQTAADAQAAVTTRVVALREDSADRAENLSSEAAAILERLRERVVLQSSDALQAVSGAVETAPARAGEAARSLRARSVAEYDILVDEGRATTRQRRAETLIQRRLAAVNERVTPSLARAAVAGRDAADRARSSQTAARLSSVAARSRRALDEAEAAAAAQHDVA